MYEEMRTGLAIEVHGLTKRYGEAVLAVDGLNLAIETNTIYSLLGPNGAGKTTTIRVLMNLIRPTTGQESIFGEDGHSGSQVLSLVVRDRHDLTASR